MHSLSSCRAIRQTESSHLIMWIRVKGGVSSQLVDESLKKNVVIKNKQAGWAGLLRSPLLSLSRGSRQVVTVVSCPVSSYLWDHVIALFIKSGAVLYSATLSFHLTILILVSLAWWRLAATAVATSHTTSQWQTFCDIVTVQIDSCATTTVELIIISVFSGDYSWYLDPRSYIQRPFPAAKFW